VDSGRSSSVQGAFERLPSRSNRRRSWRFITPWSIANAVACFHRRRAPEKTGPTGPSWALIQQIVELKSRIHGSAARGSRTSSPIHSASTSIRTWCPGCWRNTIVPCHAEPDPRGCRSSATPETGSGAWISFDASPSCCEAIGYPWSSTSSRVASSDSACSAARYGRRRVPHV